MLQLPQAKVRHSRFSRADVADITRGSLTRAKKRNDPIFGRIQEFKQALEAYRIARDEVEAIKAKHKENMRLFQCPEVFLPGADILTIARSVQERRFISLEHIDRWAKERRAFFTKKAQKKRFQPGEGGPKLYRQYIKRVSVLAPLLKAALRRATAKHKEFCARTGYDVADKRAMEALGRLWKAGRSLDRASPRSTAGAIALINFVASQLHELNSSERRIGSCGLGDCARMLECSMKILEASDVSQPHPAH